MYTTDNQDEQFIWVDENDEELGIISRYEAHSGALNIHRGIWVLVNNAQGELFMQKRSLTKDLNPGKWSISVGGHVGVGQTYEQAALREFQEELGQTGNLQKIGKVLLQGDSEREIDTVYKTHNAGPFRLKAEEIETGRFFNLKNLEQAIVQKEIVVTEWSLVLLHNYCAIIPERKDLERMIVKTF